MLVPFLKERKTCPLPRVYISYQKQRTISTRLEQRNMLSHRNVWFSTNSVILLIQKLPFTIPELVQASPCRSSDGVLYMGKANSQLGVSPFELNTLYSSVSSSSPHPCMSACLSPFHTCTINLGISRVYLEGLCVSKMRSLPREYCFNQL